MMEHAWINYRLHAWGKNELHPISKVPHSGIFGPEDLGATIIDSLDTLYLMGMMQEFRQGRKWIEKHFHINEIVSI